MLTEKEIRHAKPGDKNRLIADGGGLFLLVSPAGGKSWQFRFRHAGKELTLSLGRWPLVSAAEARRKHLHAKLELSEGSNPAAAKQVLKAEAKAQAEAEAVKADESPALTFADVAKQFLAWGKGAWSQDYLMDVSTKITRHINPRIGSLPIAEMTKADIKPMLDAMDDAGKSAMLDKVRGIISQVFNYARRHDVPGVTSNPCDLLKGRGVFRPWRPKHMAALTTESDVARLVIAIDAYTAEKSLQTGLALKFNALTFVRPTEAREAEWAEFDLMACQWNIPPGRMKMTRPHIVPLARQTLEILERLRPISGHLQYLFPALQGSPDRPMSDGTVLRAIRVMGFSKNEMCAHGFRGMASTMLNKHGWNRDWIELQLAHSDRDAVRSAYNHTDFMEGRRKMMQWWADFLSKLRNEAAGEVEREALPDARPEHGEPLPGAPAFVSSPAPSGSSKTASRTATRNYSVRGKFGAYIFRTRSYWYATRQARKCPVGTMSMLAVSDTHDFQSCSFALGHLSRAYTAFAAKAVL